MCVPSWNVDRLTPDARRVVGWVSIALAALADGACARGARVASDAVPRSTISLTPDDIADLGALLQAADARRTDTSVVDHALESATPFVRSYAARVIGQNAITSRASALRRLVTDPDSMMAADAAFALGVMRDTAAVPVLAAALAGAPTVRDAAAWSLGELGATARPAIESTLRSGQPAASVAAVLQASTKLRPVPTSLIAPYLEHPDLSVRSAAAYALTRSRVPESARPLLALASRLASPTATTGASDTHAATNLRSYVARGLAQPVAGDSLANEALMALRRLATDDQPHVRINALRSLATFGVTARPDLIAHLHDRDANVRIALAQAIGDAFANDRAVWMSAWAADTGLTYRRSLLTTALRAGVRLPGLESIGPQSWQHHADWRYRAAVAQAAAAGTATDIDAIAAPLLRDQDGRVRNAAYGAALNWVDSAGAATKPYGRAALPAALADPDLFVRASILNGLRSRARAPDASLAFDAWRRAANDPENDARLAALRVLATAWRADSASFTLELRELMAAAAPPADPVERTVGRTVGALRHWPAIVPPAKPTSWYVDQVRAFIAADVVGRPSSATINTERGSIRIRFFGADAPLTVANFTQLARRGYYNGSSFHRVVPNFVAQDGDPRGDGGGGPGYAIRDELNRRWYERGAVGMALSGPDTGGSQYFMAHSPQPHLDGHYTVFGHVTSGFDVLDALVQGDRILTVVIR